MKNHVYRIIAVLLLGIIMLTGCAGTYFTHDMRQSLHKDDLSRLQFYVDSEIVLRRAMASDEREVTPGHRLKIELGQRIEEVVIPKGCPGVLVWKEPDKLGISFEEGNEQYKNPYIIFTPLIPPSHRKAPDERLIEYHVTKGESGVYSVCYGKVYYMGKEYTMVISCGKTKVISSPPVWDRFEPVEYRRYAFLQIDADKLKKLIHERRVVPGRELEKAESGDTY